MPSTWQNRCLDTTSCSGRFRIEPADSKNRVAQVLCSRVRFAAGGAARVRPHGAVNTEANLPTCSETCSTSATMGAMEVRVVLG